MGTRELTAILAIVTITIGCSGVLGVLIAAVTATRSRGRGWSHLAGRALRLTLIIAASATLAEIVAVGWSLAG